MYSFVYLFISANRNILEYETELTNIDSILTLCFVAMPL